MKEQNMKYKISVWLLILMMIFVLTACGKDESPIESASFESEEETTLDEDKAEDDDAVDEDEEAYEPYFVEDFDLTKLDGSAASLMDYDNEIIILNFWATWCQYCIKEMPLLDEMDKRDDITVLAVSVGEEKKLVEDYIAENGYEFEVFLDEDSTLASTFGVTGFPTSVFMGKNLELYYVYPGMLDETTFDAILEAIDDIKAKNVK